MKKANETPDQEAPAYISQVAAMTAAADSQQENFPDRKIVMIINPDDYRSIPDLDKFPYKIIVSKQYRPGKTYIGVEPIEKILWKVQLSKRYLYFGVTIVSETEVRICLIPGVVIIIKKMLV